VIFCADLFSLRLPDEISRYGLISVILQALQSAPTVIPDSGGGGMGMGGAGGGEFFFETSGTLLTVICLGQLLETLAKGKTSAALTALMQLQAPTAALITVDADSHAVLRSSVPIQCRASHGNQHTCNHVVVTNTQSGSSMSDMFFLLHVS
jgi:hypothetical protein